jgi:hypothetical protein
MQCDCGQPIHPARYALGYLTCLPCGEREARQRKHTVVCINKVGYMAFSASAARTVVKQLNPKRTT